MKVYLHSKFAACLPVFPKYTLEPFLSLWTISGYAERNEIFPLSMFHRHSSENNQRILLLDSIVIGFIIVITICDCH